MSVDIIIDPEDLLFIFPSSNYLQLFFYNLLHYDYVGPAYPAAQGSCVYSKQTPIGKKRKCRVAGK